MTRGGPPRGRRGGPERPRGNERPVADTGTVYGRNPVRELLAARRRAVREILVAGRAEELDWLAGAPAPVRRVDPHELDLIAGTDDHQGVVARAASYPLVEVEDLYAAPDPLIVALDGITDPRNLGAIARTAECMGAVGIVVPRHGSAPVTGVVCKASAGAVEHLRIAEVRNLADWLVEARRHGTWAFAADGDDGAPPASLDLGGAIVLVLGAEGTGVRPRVRAACDGGVRIPMAGAIGSLNVAVAAGMLLYEAARQRAARPLG